VFGSWAAAPSSNVGVDPKMPYMKPDKMIDRGHRRPLGRHARPPGIIRCSLYCDPRLMSAADLAIMRRLDELHLDHPYLFGAGHDSQQRMGIKAINQRPHTSKSSTGRKVFPYLLRGMRIARKQVRPMDTT
jgi:putative transposase